MLPPRSRHDDKRSSRKERNKQSARKSRERTKKQKQELNEQFLAQGETLERLERVLMGQEAKLRSIRQEGNAEFALDYSSATEIDLSFSEELLAKTENALYLKLLRPDPSMPTHVLFDPEDPSRGKQGSSSAAQALDSILHILALDSAGTVVAVRHRNLFSCETWEAGALKGKLAWDDLHERDAPELKRQVENCLEMRKARNQRSTVILQYRRKVTAGTAAEDATTASDSFARMKGTLEPIFNNHPRALGVVLAEFNEERL
mmetsp:Transcript_28949/g.112632  ORF Transcript_28949/g.112632 Transcript_28949/m.112632 type:complete len:261 (+) Transcript_28949:92-874(+)